MATTQKPVGVTVAKLPIWFDRENLKVRKDQEEVCDQLEWCLSDPGAGILADVLLGKGTFVPDPKKEMRALVDRLISQFPSKKSNAALVILSRVVREYNEIKGGSLPLPEFAVKLPSVENPFTADRWGGLSKIRRWRRALLDDITSRPNLDDLELASGRVLTSSVLLGGLVARNSLDAVYRLLPRWTVHTEMMNERLAVSWTDSGSNYYRWFPDAMTASLLLRLPRNQSEFSVLEAENHGTTKVRQAVTRSIVSYMNFASPAKDHLHDSLREFLDAALLDLEVRMPRALTEYAFGRQISYSLRPVAWRRVMGAAAHAESDATEEVSNPNTEVEAGFSTGSEVQDGNVEEGSLGNGKDSNDEQPRDGDSDPEWLRTLRDCLHSARKRADITFTLNKIQSLLGAPNNPTVLKVFAGFAQHLLEEKNKSRKGSRLNSVRTQVIAVAKRLPSAIQFEKPGSLNGETLQGAYQQILEDAISENQRQKLAGALRAFHHYLVDTRFVENIDEGEVFASATANLTVDANLILEKEYQRALEHLKNWNARDSSHPPPPKKVREIARLLLILGFRCGLRRMEALKLQLADLNENMPAELLIRPWEERRLKTPNATRKLPLQALLSGAELEALRAWKEQREEENKRQANPSPYLFAIPEMEYTSVPEAFVFPLVHKALRAATQDESIHFHHLRHSCGSWLAYALLQPSKPAKKQSSVWLAAWSGANRWICSPHLHRELYGNRFPTRRHLFSIARLLGHSSSEMTCENYIHVYDQLFALWRDNHLPQYKPETWTAASGLSPRMVTKLLRPDSCWSLVGKICEGIPELRCKAKAQANDPKRAPKDANQNQSIETDQQAVLALERLWLLLYLDKNEGLEIEDLSHRLALSGPFVEQLLLVAKEVAQRQNEDINHSCPRKPHEGAELSIFNRFAAPLWKLLSNKPDFCRPVLKHFLDGVACHRNGVEFLPQAKKLASQYLKFLRLLKVQPEEILFIRYATADRFHFWHSPLGLTGNEMVQSASPMSRQKADENVAGIKLVFDPADKNALPNDKKASYGMRYLLTMAGIWIEAKDRVAPCVKAQSHP